MCIANHLGGDLAIKASSQKGLLGGIAQLRRKSTHNGQMNDVLSHSNSFTSKQDSKMTIKVSSRKISNVTGKHSSTKMTTKKSSKQKSDHKHFTSHNTRYARAPYLGVYIASSPLK